MFEYNAKVLKVVDGDTLHVEVDLGCEVRINLTVRLARINAPEMKTPAGVTSRDYVAKWVEDQGGLIVVRTVKDRREKYGRYLAEVYGRSGIPTRSLNQDLVDAGLAVLYAS